MKEKYEKPIIQFIAFEPADVLTASVEAGDNVIEDNIFD